MFFAPLWRAGGASSAANVTQVGVEILQQDGITAVTQAGAELLQQSGETVLSQFGAAGLLARRRTRVTQIAALLIWGPSEPEPPPEPGVPCVTAPPVVHTAVCGQPNLAPLTCPLEPTGSTWRQTNSEPAVQSLGLNESDVQP